MQNFDHSKIGSAVFKLAPDKQLYLMHCDPNLLTHGMSLNILYIKKFK